MAHALLSASSANRWMVCTPSARLTENIPDNETNVSAEEGTLAHSLAELMARYNLNKIKKIIYEGQLLKIKKHELYTDEMLEHAGDFSNYCHNIYLEAKKEAGEVIMQLETRVNFSHYVPDGFGTCDVLIVRDGTIDIIDFKYGKGVEVPAENNKQLMLYALGAIEEFDFLFDIKDIRMTIYQPRKNNISTFIMSVKDLMEWAENELKPKALLAFDGAGEQVAGEHCRFCKLKPTCRKLAEENLSLSKYKYKPATTLSNSEIADILKVAKRLTDWAKNVEDYALRQALKGEKFTGWKVVEGKSVRKYSDEEAVSKELIADGYSKDDIYTKSLLGITAMEKLLGKKHFNEVLGGLVIKPPGSPTLAPITDKRGEFNGIDSARADFANIEV